MTKRMKEVEAQRKELISKVKAVRELHQHYTIGGRLLTEQLLTETDRVRIERAKNCIAGGEKRIKELKSEWIELDARLSRLNNKEIETGTRINKGVKMEKNLQSVLVKAYFKNDAGDLIENYVRVSFIESGFDTDAQEEFADVSIKFGTGWEEIITFWTYNNEISGISGNRFDVFSMSDNAKLFNAVKDLAGWK